MLVVISGLPGSGKSAMAQALASRWRAMQLSVDVIEEALLGAGSPPGWTTGVAAYDVAGALAATNLLMGLIVVVDAVNDSQPARDTWRRAAVEAGCELHLVLLHCSDQAEHKRRLSARRRSFQHVPEPTWEAVEERARRSAPWLEPHTSIDTSQPLVDTVQQVEAVIFGPRK